MLTSGAGVLAGVCEREGDGLRWAELGCGGKQKKGKKWGHQVGLERRERNRDASGAGRAASPPAQPAPPTRVARATNPHRRSGPRGFARGTRWHRKPPRPHLRPLRHTTSAGLITFSILSHDAGQHRRLPTPHGAAVVLDARGRRR
jgi:hypothetical protein